MKLKRVIVVSMFASLVMCTACSKEAAIETNKTEVEPTQASVSALVENTKEIGKEDTEESGKETTLVESVTTEEESTLTEKEVERQESLEAYEKFMRNEAKLSFTQFMPKDFMDESLYEEGSEYTLSEILDIITDLYYENSTNKKMKYIEYSYIDCGKDEVYELILQLHGMDIYGEEDDSTLSYIIKYINGKLALCYSYETWARSESTINEYGYYRSYGSGGASYHIEEYGLIDKDGNWKLIASIHNELDINQLTWSDELGQLPKVAESKGISGGIELQTVFINTNDNDVNSDEAGNQVRFYTFYVYDDNMEPIEDANLYTNSIYKDIFDEAMVPYITPDEISAMISEKEKKVGATTQVKEGKEMEWKVLSGNMYSDYVGR